MSEWKYDAKLVWLIDSFELILVLFVMIDEEVRQEKEEEQ